VRSEGAKEQYAETAEWLDSFARDLERILEHVTDNPTAKYTENIKQQITNIDRHYVHCEKYALKQDAVKQTVRDIATQLQIPYASSILSSSPTLCL
jgi:uncharacterized membrane-anchored protein YhcB (DUF1043 family)